MSCAEIASEIGQSLELLSTTSRSIPERHRSLKAAFEHSWQRLTAKEQEVLRKLSVFVGGFRREAAGEVAQATIPILASLVDKSLLRVLPNGRYDRHPLLYQFTREKLAVRTDEAVQIAAHHLEFFLHLAENAESDLRGKIQAQVYVRLAEELDNLRAALNWALEQTEIEKGLRLSTALWRFWSNKGHVAEGMDWLGRLFEAGPSTKPSIPPYAKAFYVAGLLALALGNYDRASLWTEQSLVIARSLGDNQRIGDALNTLGILADDRGDYTEAHAFYEGALSARRAANDRIGIASALGNLGNVAFGRGNYTSALTFYSESLELFQTLGDTSMVGQSLLNLGYVALQLGDLGAARSQLEKSLAMLRMLDNKTLLPANLRFLGMVSQEQGDYKRARTYTEEGLELARAAGNERSTAYSLLHLAELALAEGNLAEARLKLAASLPFHLRVGDKQGRAGCLNGLGRAASLEGNSSLAVSYYAASLALHKEMGSDHGALEVLNFLAEEGTKLECYTDAALLSSATEALRITLKLIPTPSERARCENTRSACLAQLSPNVFTNLWSEGQTLSLDQATRLAYTMVEHFGTPAEPLISDV